MIEQASESVYDLLEYGWAIIANAGHGDWDNESEQWRGAAKRFRDRYHVLMSATPTEQASVPSRHRAAAHRIACMAEGMYGARYVPRDDIDRIAAILVEEFPVSPAPASEPGLRERLAPVARYICNQYMINEPADQENVLRDLMAGVGPAAPASEELERLKQAARDVLADIGDALHLLCRGESAEVRLKEARRTLSLAMYVCEATPSPTAEKGTE